MAQTLRPRSAHHSIDRGYSHPKALRVAYLWVSSTWLPGLLSESEVLLRCRSGLAGLPYT